TPIKVSVNPAGLASGAYYGTIQVSADGVLNSPQTFTVVLHVFPQGTPIGAYLDSSGLVFLGAQGAADPPPQTVAISNPTSGNLSYTSTISITAGANVWSFSPLSGTIASGQSGTLNVQAKLAGVPPGIYAAQIRMAYSDGSTRFVNLLLVV